MQDGRTWRRYALLLTPAALFLALTLPHLGQGDWRGDSGWYSAIAVQAWRTGEFWTLAAEPGRPYFNKPPLVFWLHGAFLHAFGANLVSARLPTVLAGLGCVILTGSIARRFVSPANAAVCASILATTYEFFRRVREISLDMWQLLFILLAVLAVVALPARRAAVGFALAGFSLGLAMMCKPLMAGIAIIPLAIWLILAGRLRQLQWLLLTTACAAAVAAPWHLSMAASHGEAFTAQYFGTEIGTRIGGTPMGGQFQHEPWWFYLGQLVTGYWPWLLIAVPAVFAVPFGEPEVRSRQLRLLGVSWFICWYVALTIFPDRRDRYALPLYPGLALAGGAWLWWTLKPHAQAAVERAMSLAGPIAVVVGITVAVLPVRVQRPPDAQWPALIAWLESNAPDGVWEGACAGAPAARIYLQTGRWPRPAKEGSPEHMPPPGSLLLYHRRGGRMPGPDETVVFEGGDLKVTRLDGPAWNPIPFPDPGER